MHNVDYMSDRHMTLIQMGYHYNLDLSVTQVTTRSTTLENDPVCRNLFPIGSLVKKTEIETI